MKETIMKKYRLLNRIMDRISENHTGAYAAQSAFFIVLSMIPFIMLLLALVQYTPVTKADVIRAVTHVLPKTIYPMIVSIVNQVYNQSQAMISLTGLVAIWSAGRGVLAMSAGLNSVYGSKETRNYIYLRLRAAFYTVLFIIAIVLSLVILGFGDRLSIFIVNHYPFMKGIIDLIINIRAVASIVVLTVFSMTIYHFLPNKKTKFIRQFPGAFLTAVGWAAASYIFSAYVNIFTGFSTMYGSMTTIMLIMLWLYACMYIMLLGGEVNEMLAEDFFTSM